MLCRFKKEVSKSDPAISLSVQDCGIYLLQATAYLNANRLTSLGERPNYISAAFRRFYTSNFLVRLEHFHKRTQYEFCDLFIFKLKFINFLFICFQSRLFCILRLFTFWCLEYLSWALMRLVTTSRIWTSGSGVNTFSAYVLYV